jgi:hypothetical protein
LGIVGFHYFTFNRLAATVAWDRQHLPAPHSLVREALDV